MYKNRELIQSLLMLMYFMGVFYVLSRQANQGGAEWSVEYFAFSSFTLISGTTSLCLGLLDIIAFGQMQALGDTESPPTSDDDPRAPPPIRRRINNDRC